MQKVMFYYFIPFLLVILSCYKYTDVDLSDIRKEDYVRIIKVSGDTVVIRDTTMDPDGLAGHVYRREVKRTEYLGETTIPSDSIKYSQVRALDMNKTVRNTAIGLGMLYLSAYLIASQTQ